MNLKFTTRTKLIAAFFLVALVPMILLAIVNGQTTRQALIDDANQALFAVSSQTAESLDSFFSTNMKEISTEAQLPTLVDFLELYQDGETDSIAESEVIKLLNTLENKNDQITSYALINNDGEVLVDSIVSKMGLNKSDRPYFSYFYGEHDTDNFASPVEFSPTTGEASLYFSSAVHAEDSSVLGVLRVRYNAEVLQTLIEEKNNLAGQDSFGVLFDDYYVHLAHGVEPQVNFIPIIQFDSQTDQMLKDAMRLPDLPDSELYIMQLDDLEEHLSNPETQRFFEAEDVATGDLINQVALAEMETQPWLVAFFQPQEIFLAPVNAQNQNTAVLVGVFSIAAVLIAFIFGNTISKPIINLTDTVTDFTGGDLETRSTIQSDDEIGVLAKSFNNMATRVQTLLTGLEQQTKELQGEVNERTQAEELLRVSEERYRSISDLTSDYIYSVTVLPNNELGLNWSTEAFNRFTGYTPSELDERGGWKSLIHPEDIETYQTNRNKLLETGESDASEYRIITKDGLIRWLRDYRQAFMDEEANRVTRLLGAAKDITEEKLYGQELEQARDIAETANRTKGIFLANMSHELRTPLNAIIGFTQILTSSENLSPEQREQIEIINSSGEHLLTLINDVLEMSKIEAGQTTLQENNFNVVNLLNEVEDMLSLRAKSKGLNLLVERSSDMPHFIRTDQSKLRQILINLINNAIKFTNEGGVSIRTRYEKNKDHRLYFEVEDSGEGIAPDEIETLFEAFVQSTTGKKAKEGTGLGLSISREFIRLMDGDIRVNSQIGKGSLFKFDIKIELAAEEEIIVDTPPRQVIGLEPGQPNYRILIVDDISENRKLLSTLLQPLGFEIKEAENGREAFDIWHAWEPDLIWMDMRMPVMDGYEATTWIRSMPNGADTVIIALTASAFEENRAMSLEAGGKSVV